MNDEIATLRFFTAPAHEWRFAYEIVVQLAAV
jgi:hypothetical protein